MNDLDLMVLFTFLRDVLPLAAWERAFVHYGPGLIDLELQAMSDRDVRELVAALRKIPERLSAFGECIPREMLNQRKIAPGVLFADYPVKPLLDSALRLEKLIAHGITT